VFTRAGASWEEEAKLTAAEELGRGSFGESVALSSDGSTALVSGSGDDGGAGAVRVFTRSGHTWSQQAKLTGTEGANHSFGRDVALSSDGGTAVIGDPGARGGLGVAWVFTRAGASWSTQAALAGSDAVGRARTGRSVAVSADGDTALVGAWNDNGATGAAWVFTRSGTAWTQQGQKL